MAFDLTLSILLVILHLGVYTNGHSWSTQWVLATLSRVLTHIFSNSILASTMVTSVTHSTSATPTGALAAASKSSAAPSSSIAIGIGDSSSNTSQTLVIPVIALSISLGVLSVLLICLSVCLCMRRSQSHELATVNHVGPTNLTPAVDSRTHHSLHAAATPTTEIAIKASSQQPPLQPSTSFQPDIPKLQQHDNPSEDPLPSRVEKVEESVFGSFVTNEAKANETSSGAVSVEAFSCGRDEEFHPEIRDLIVEDNLTKEAVMRMTPMKPQMGTVMPDYNPKLDETRPREVKEYLQSVI
jgi:hypothetical protein